MATELRTLSAHTSYALKVKIIDAINQGWQPYDRILNAGSTSIGIIVAKGTDAQITDVEIITSTSRDGLVSSINALIANGWEMFVAQEVNAARFVAFLTKGSQGSTGGGGEVGPQGPKGEDGEKGDKGDVGERGPAGAAGTAGATGPAGPKGDTGPAGAKGATGDQGPMGPAGPTGPKGGTGATGTVGPQGPRGLQGEQGVPGEVGPAGLTFQGAWSDASAYVKDDTVVYDGSTWFAPGPVTAGLVPGVAPEWILLAAQGARGEDGPQGPAGPQGLQGATGPTGPAGAAGETGPQGPRGLQGAAGAVGPTGPQGEAGPQGIRGPQGIAGHQGLKGDTGPVGPAAPELYTYHRSSNIATGVIDYVLPGSPDTYLRLNYNGSGSITYTLVSAAAPNRYADWYFEVPSATGTNAITIIGGSATIGASTIHQMGNIAYSSLRRFNITIKEWGSKRIYNIEVWHHGRTGDSTRPVTLRMESFPY